MTHPNVKNYLDCYQYLQDIYNYFKSIHAEFSYQAWCNDMDVKSKSYLRFAIYGKRKISPELAKKLSLWLKLNTEDCEYFLLLIEYTQTSIPEIKRALSQKMIEKIKLDQSNTKKVQLQVSNPLLIQIRDLLSFKDISHNEKTLSHVFNQPLETIHQALQVLESLGWIVRNSDDSWTASEKSIQIEDDQGNSLLHEFHTSSLQEALKHIKTEELHRKFRSLHLTLSEEEFKDFHHKISTL